MTRDYDIEEKTLDIGEEIFDAIKEDVPAFFNVRKWKGRVMEVVIGVVPSQLFDIKE